MIKRPVACSTPQKPMRTKTLFHLLMTRRTSLLALALLVALASVYSLALPETASVVSKRRELPIYCVAREDNVIAISFDAAWGGDKTETILDILDQYDVKTTFFLVDIWTQKFPELVKEIAARGHEIGNHSTSHPHMSQLSEAAIIKELSVMSDNVSALTGVRPTLFRPPYGDYNDRLISVARVQGYEPIQWSVDSQDWKNRGADDIVRRATRVQSGDIVLFHNDSQYIVEALPAVLDYYRKNGYKIVPVSEILLSGETTIDIQGRQQPTSTKIPEV